MISIFFYDPSSLVLGIGCVLFGGYGIAEYINEYRLELEKNKQQKIDNLTNPDKVKLDKKQVIIGYEKRGCLKWPLVIDMGITPHILICGLSNSGKTKMVEYAMRNKNVVILNADLTKDFKKFKCHKISEFGSMLTFLKNAVNQYHENSLYIVIDELLVLSNQKEISIAIMDLLAVARHKNIYLIGISQSGEKEVLKYKHLFNVRICFRMVEESSYRAVLGYSPEQKDLRQRQFLYYSDRIGLGYTYDV